MLVETFPPATPHASAKTSHYCGIDLLRCLAMFMIVMLHLLGHGGVLKGAEGGRFFAFYFLEASCYGAVDLFAMISGYLLVFSEWKLSRYFSLYAHVAFYTILFVFLEKFAFGGNPSGREFLAAFIALKGNYWYITSYVGVLFLMPLLNAFLKEMDFRKNYRKVIFCIFVICFASTLISKFIGFAAGYSCAWLSAMYLVGGMIRINQSEIEKIPGNPGRKRLTLLAVYICLSLLAVLGVKIFRGSLLEGLFLSYCSPVIVVSTIALFIAFFDLKLAENSLLRKLLQTLSPATLGVYLITESRYIRPRIMTEKFAWICDEPIICGVIYVFVFAIILFTVPLLLDFCRYKLFQYLQINRMMLLGSDAITGIYCRSMDRLFLRLFPKK